MKFVVYLSYLMLFISAESLAHPTSFPYNRHFTVEQSSELSALEGHYQFNSDTAAGFYTFNAYNTDVKESTDKPENSRLIQGRLLSLSKRLWRKNEHDAQSNLYVSAYAGELSDPYNSQVSGADNSALGYLIQADTESRAYHFLAKTQQIKRLNGGSYTTSDLMAGFSFTPEANYSDPSVWGMLKIAKNSFTKPDGLKVVPMISLIHKKVFFEIGKEINGPIELKIMFNF